MSQAEIAGGAFTSQNELPSKGHRIHDFALVSALGRTIHLSDYRGHANLVLILGDERPQTAKLISDAASQYAEIKNEEAELLAIMRMPREQAADTKGVANPFCPRVLIPVFTTRTKARAFLSAPAAKTQALRENPALPEGPPPGVKIAKNRVR